MCIWHIKTDSKDRIDFIIVEVCDTIGLTVMYSEHAIM